MGKYANIASRSAGFIEKYFAGELAAAWPEVEILTELQHAGALLADCYEQGDYAEAMRLIMAHADRANAYIDAEKPWVLAKDTAQRQRLHAVASVGINLFRLLTLYLKPVLPRIAAAAEQFLNVPALHWNAAATLLTGHRIHSYQHLVQRIEPEAVNRMLEDSKTEPAVAQAPATPLALDPLREAISYEDFAKIDLRIARIVAAEAVPEADKLLRLTLDVGGEQRNVFAGIKEAYDPAALVGRLTVMVANLAPRKMRFGVSEGMVLAAGPGKNDLWILAPDDGAEPGMRVK